MQPVNYSSPVFTGEKHDIHLPTGRIATIRETNGEDDAIISKMSGAQSGESILNFVANITTHDSVLGRKPMVDDIRAWPVSDRYYLLYKQRLINQGTLLEFRHTCSNPDCAYCRDAEPQDKEQDLTEFDGDLTNPDFKAKNSNQVRRYPNGDKVEVEFSLSSGKKLKYKILTGELEKKQLDIPQDDNNRNTKLIVRELSVFDNGVWIPLKSFLAFKSKEMSEIRKHVDDNDPLFDPLINFTCNLCKMPYRIPLLSIPAFFWPGELT